MLLVELLVGCGLVLVGLFFLQIIDGVEFDTATEKTDSENVGIGFIVLGGFVLIGAILLFFQKFLTFQQYLRTLLAGIYLVVSLYVLILSIFYGFLDSSGLQKLEQNITGVSESLVSRIHKDRAYWLGVSIFATLYSIYNIFMQFLNLKAQEMEVAFLQQMQTGQPNQTPAPLKPSNSSVKLNPEEQAKMNTMSQQASKKNDIVLADQSNANTILQDPNNNSKLNETNDNLLRVDPKNNGFPGDNLLSAEYNKTQTSFSHLNNPQLNLNDPNNPQYLPNPMMSSQQFTPSINNWNLQNLENAPKLANQPNQPSQNQFYLPPPYNRQKRVQKESIINQTWEMQQIRDHDTGKLFNVVLPGIQK